MDQKERQVIDDLFGKIRQVAAQSPQRDAEAEAYIGRQVAAVPGAPYYMAQALLVQEQALASAQSRIQQLEQQAASPRQSGGGGFLSGLFGGGQQAAPPPRQAYAPQPQYVPPQYMQPAGGYGPWGGGGRMGGGGFLAGAAQTAVGVAGGVLAAEAIQHAFSGFGGSEAHAAGLTDQLGAGDTGPMADQLGAGDVGAGPWGGQQDALDPSQDQGVVDQGYADPSLGYADPGADDYGGGDDFGNDDNTV